MKYKKLQKIISFILCLVLILSITAYAHPGRTDSQGGHWNRSTGTYHYHNGGSNISSTPSYSNSISSTSVEELSIKEENLKKQEQDLVKLYDNLIAQTEISLKQYGNYLESEKKYLTSTGRSSLPFVKQFVYFPEVKTVKLYKDLYLIKERKNDKNFPLLYESELNLWENDLLNAKTELDNLIRDSRNSSSALTANTENLNFLLVQINAASVSVVNAKNLIIHFIDVGQADCILIQTPTGKSMLIDAGNNADSQTILSYLKDKKITTIDVLVGTHPHEDHIGSMDEVVRNIDVKSVYMPKVTANTDTFLSVLQAIKDKGLKISALTPWGKIYLDSQVDITVLAPSSDKYEDINNYSGVLKVVYKNTSFLLTGDAEAISEAEMLKKGFNLRADILKVAHHGSSSSTTAAFIKAVSPKVAIVSVGKGNSYGHPAADTLQRLAANNTAIYRTDEVGTIVVTSDGNTVKVDKKASSIKPNAPPSSIVSSGISNGKVYITKTGTKYHNDGCRYLSQSKIEIDIKDAVARSYTACSVCKPQELSGNSITNKAPPATEQKEVTVYITKTGAKYHNAGCRYLSRSMIPIGLKNAKSSGYTPCSVCGPPR